MRKLIRAFVLVLTLAIPTFAGEIPNNVTGDIPKGATAAGDIQNGVAGDIPYGATDYIPYGATSQTDVINFLLSLLSLI